MKILITGGLGNLGSWITESLFASGFEITTFSSRDRNVLRDRQFERVFGEIENEGDLRRLFRGKSWDAVIHLASVNEITLPDYPKKALAVNALGTRNLLQTIADCGNRPHFIYFSTFHVYGPGRGVLEENASLPNPQNDYASTHLFAEYYVKQFNNSHAIPFTIFRLTNSYGCPKEIHNSKWHLILNDLAKMAVEKKKIVLNSNGRSRRDFIWMGDVCEAVKKCINEGAANDVFNLGSGTNLRTIEVAETVKRAYENRYSAPIEIEVNNSDFNTYENFFNVSINKLQNWISFRPQNKLYEEAIAIFDLLKESKN